MRGCTLRSREEHSDRAYHYRFGSAEYDALRQELRVDGNLVELERRPLEVLALLLAYANEVVTREELLAEVWQGRVTVDNVLANAVAKLRKGLGEANAAFVVTHPKLGYRLAAPVERSATGRHMETRLSLSVGDPVPHRPHFRLKQQLYGNRASEVWRACHSGTQEARVYKFGPDGERLKQLKREVAVHHLLSQGAADPQKFCRLIDWNFSSPPFFVEYADAGTDLLHWQEGGGGQAWEQLALRLDLGKQAVAAIATAHELGVLHKDLKPANLLVDTDETGKWQLRVADFGAATTADPAALAALGITALGITLDKRDTISPTGGTPLYMAPELLAGEPHTVRSDIYAMGVILYQLLAGDMRKPMATGWEQDIMDPLLREDIATATHGDPSQRTASAALLSRQLATLEERYHRRKEQQAAAHRAALSEQKLARLKARRPWVIVTSAALTLGLVASLWFGAQATIARQSTLQAAQRADAVGAFLSDLLIHADPKTPGASGNVTVREALDRAVAHIDSRFANARDAEIPIREKAADIYTALAEYREAVEQRTKALELLKALRGPQHVETLMAQYRLVESLSNASLYAEAEDMLTLTDRSAGDVTSPQLAFLAMKSRGRFHLLQADISPAVEAFEAALLIDDRSAADTATRFALELDLAQAYSRLGRHAEATTRLQELIDSRGDAASISAGSLASARLYLGASLLYAARYVEAEPILLASINELTAVFGESAPQVAEAYSALGNLYATSGRWQEAYAVLGTVRNQLCAHHGQDHLTCMMARGNHGVASYHYGRLYEGIEEMAAAREAFEAALGSTSPGVHVLGYYLAMAELDAGLAQAATAHAAPLDARQLEAGSPGQHWGARTDGLQARILLAQGQCGDGRAQLATAVQTMRHNGLQEWILAPFERDLVAPCPITAI